MKLIDSMKKRDKESYPIPKSIQQWMPIHRVYPDGIFLYRDRYSKTFRFTDVNYKIASPDDQRSMFMKWCAVINSLDVGASIKLTLFNRRVNKNDYEESIMMPLQGDEHDPYRREWNRFVEDQAVSASNNITQDKLLTVSVQKKSIEEARSYFTRINAELQANFAHLSSQLTALDATERLRIFHDFFRTGKEEEFHFDLRRSAQRGHSPVDYICPDSIEVENDHFCIDGHYGRVLFLRDYANYIKDKILDDFSELNRTMMLTIDMNPVPTDEAVKRSTMQLDKVEANVLRYNQRQQANSNFSGALPHDMEIQRKEAREFLEDLTTRDQRMLMCCMTLVHMADSREEMERDTESLFSIARNHLCQMSTLRYQQADGLNTVLPYGVRMIEALRTMTTESTAVMIPFKTQELHDTSGICYGHNIISKNLLVINRKNLLNGNGFVFGVSGSGKSFITKEELINVALNTDDEILVIDPEQEYGRLVRALGGEVINISATSPNHINAMDVSREYGDVENPIILKSEFILSLCEMAVGTGALNAKEKSLIDRCIASTYKPFVQRGYTGNPPTLQNFHQELLKQSEPEAREIALALELFTKGSLNTFAQLTNVDTTRRIVCFDIHELGKQLKPLGMLVVLDAIYNRIARNKEMKRNTWIYIDEIYLLFQNDYSANFLFELWKRVRKSGAFATGISQNLEDMLQSHTARTMLGNSEFLILLNQSASDRVELARLLNISEEQLRYITDAGVGKGLIRCSGNIVPFESQFPKDSRLYQLMTTKLSETEDEHEEENTDGKPKRRKY